MIRDVTFSVVINWSNQNSEYVEQLRDLPQYCREILLATTGNPELPEGVGDHRVQVVSSDEDTGRVARLNKAIEKAAGDWLLLLEESELIYLPGFEQLPLDSDSEAYAARIQKKDDPAKRVTYEIRILPNTGSIAIGGKNLPDFSPVLEQHNLQLNKQAFDILRERELIPKVDMDEELEYDTRHGIAMVMKGVNLAAKGAYEEAIKWFQSAHQSDRLLWFDQAAALNGLADAAYELNNWQESRRHAHKALEITTSQRMPYLVLFRTAFGSNHWKEAYEHLYNYLEVLASGTDVNHDVYFPLSDTHYLLGEAAYRYGWHERALAHYEQYYDLKKGNIQQEVIERLLLYAIELSEHDRALTYFNHLFGDLIKDPLSEADESRILEVLSLFMEQGWHEFSLEVFEILCNNNPDKPELMRRWVAALIRAKKVEKAQEIIAKHETKFA